MSGLQEVTEGLAEVTNVVEWDQDNEQIGWHIEVPEGVTRMELYLVKNAQRSKTVKVLSRGYANESSGASIKARFQKSGSSYYLGHRDPKHTVHYPRVAAGRFEGLWR
jgi:hypothetical protein